VVFDKRILLDVPRGARGLRQSDAVFQHTRNLASLFDEADLANAVCVSVSSKPRDAAASYMPVFTAGVGAAKAVRAAAGCRYYEFSHQQGHIAAGLYGADKQVWQNAPFLVLHLSGGTTELLRTDGNGTAVVGKTLDIPAGQLIDRTGVMLGLEFPCGKRLEELAARKTEDLRFPVSVNGTEVNFSGAEAKAAQSRETPENIAAAVLRCVAETVKKMIDNARNAYDLENVLIVGGVAANRQLRAYIGGAAVFAPPRLAADNAVGTALLGQAHYRRGLDK
jgi:N6-L-threonylcarbamoyladenine synthase